MRTTPKHSTSTDEVNSRKNNNTNKENTKAIKCTRNTVEQQRASELKIVYFKKNIIYEYVNILTITMPTTTTNDSNSNNVGDDDNDDDDGI